MSIGTTTWSKKKRADVYWFSVFTPGSTSLIFEVTALASRDPGRDRRTQSGVEGWGSKVVKTSASLQWMSWGVCRCPEQTVTITCTLRRKYMPILPVQPTDHINTSFHHAENLLIVKPLAVMAIKYKRKQDSWWNKTNLCICKAAWSVKRKWEHLPAKWDFS